MINNLAYVGIESPAADEWRTFGPDLLGIPTTGDGPDGAVRLRVDERAWRIAVHPGERDDLAYLGWDVADRATLDKTVARVEKAGMTVVDGDDELAALREVERVAWFVDPFGLRHELVIGAAARDGFEPTAGMAGGFVTGDQGLGHVVLIVPDLEAGHRFLTDTLGMVLSDTVSVGIEIRFYHCRGSASRHHSLAISGAPGHVGLHHIMLEVSEADDVGRALDRVKDAGVPLAMDYGRHPNDLMSSFYVRTPSGFELEYGTGGVVIDDATWEPATYHATSLWGHRPPEDGPLRPGVLKRVEPAGSRGAD